MSEVLFTGRVLPSTVQLTLFGQDPSVNWFDSQENLNIKITISVKNSMVYAKCELERFDRKAHLIRVYLRAFDIARAVVNLAAFNSGIGLTVVFETFTSPFGVTEPFISADPKLSTLCTAYNMTVKHNNEDFNKVVRIIHSDWRAAHVLHWLIEAITLPHESGVNCARAVEGLRNIIAPNQPPPKGWKEMRDTLNISQDYLKMITDASRGPRHADHEHVPGAITTEVTYRAWTIMNRFFEYKKRDAGPLPLAEFPLLVP